jgi:hypothetical protein
MFDFHDFVFRTIKGMVGNEADYKVRARALAWNEKDVLTVDDLSEIDKSIEALYPAEEAGTSNE